MQKNKKNIDIIKNNTRNVHSTGIYPYIQSNNNNNNNSCKSETLHQHALDCQRFREVQKQRDKPKKQWSF